MQRLPGPHNRIFSSSKSLEASIRAEIEKHKLDLDPSNPRDYINAFLIERRVCYSQSMYSVYEPKTNMSVKWLYFCFYILSVRTTVSWVLTMETWSCVVWISSWLVVKQHQRPYSGASSTSLKTFKSKVGIKIGLQQQQKQREQI